MPSKRANGIKATAWEVTSKRTPAAFFQEHTIAELLTWSDHDLEEQGRLTDPLKWDASVDKYVPVPWEEAFAAIGSHLRRLDPKSVVFYASGRASLETADREWRLRPPR
jgi:anaerobic selenocysteine-containing dehydrogenase